MKRHSTSGAIYSRRNLCFLLMAFAAMLLAACGSGGGGSQQSGNSNAVITLSSQTVSVSAMSSQPAPTADVQVGVADLSISGEVYIKVTYSGNGIANATIAPGGTLPATVMIQFESPASLGLGTYNGTVTVNVCFDQSCSQPLSNSPQTVQVHYTVMKSTFTVTSLSPTSAYAGIQVFTLTVNGSTFTQQSTVLWNGNSLPTTYVSGSQLTAEVSAIDVTAAGSATISVNDPTYGISNTATFTINASPLTITSLSPAAINAGNPAFTLAVTGTDFTTNSTVLWNGNPQATTYVNPTQLTSQIPAANVATPGTASVSINDPIYGSSSAETFTITPLSLTLTSVSPQTVTAGGASFVLTALGTAFTGTSTVEWNGAALATTLVSSTELIAQVPASDIISTGTASVMVADSNSPPGSTAVQLVTIAPPSIDAVAYQMNSEHNGAVTFSSVSFPAAAKWSVNVGGTPSYALITGGKVIVTVQLTSSSSQLLVLDKATGNTVWGPVLISGLANATYDNGHVFVLCAPSVGPATLEAYDVNNGVLDWSTVLTGQYFFTGAPTVADGTIYAVGSESGNTIYAVDESNGALLWTNNVNTGTSITPTVTVDGVYISFPCTSYDLRPATGEIIWQTQPSCGGGGGGMPVVANQLDYAPNTAYSYNGNILDADTGANVGSYLADTPPAFTSAMGYFLQGGTLRGVDLSNNTVAWTFNGDGQLAGAPIAVNQYVFIGSSSGNLYALDGATGTQVWNVNLGAPIGASVLTMPLTGLAAGDGLLVVPAGNTVTAYTLSTNP